MLTVSAFGLGHLAEVWDAALDMLPGVEFVCREEYFDLCFVVQDVEDHKDLTVVEQWVDEALEMANGQPVVVVSQVPPGFCRKYDAINLLYQMDTIIVKNALYRVLYPEQVVVGLHPEAGALPLDYQRFLLSYPAQSPFQVLPCIYEDAEFAKMAINFYLHEQISIARFLSSRASDMDANWDLVKAVLQQDRRIGPHAYLEPGSPNKHLMRDVTTLSQGVGRKIGSTDG